ncbi:hypothetical protein DFAR_1260039 [Desulfarculales bacterium]
MPQGRGKIERFFRTVRSQFLSGFKGGYPSGHQLGPRVLDQGHLPPAQASGHRTGPPCNASPARWNAPGWPTLTWKTIWTAPSPWPADYTRPQYL